MALRCRRRPGPSHGERQRLEPASDTSGVAPRRVDITGVTAAQRATARLTTKGLGDTKAALPNTTAAGRAQNRRVEVAKQ